jgi:hypothetical protein
VSRVIWFTSVGAFLLAEAGVSRWRRRLTMTGMTDPFVPPGSFQIWEAHSIG